MSSPPARVLRRLVLVQVAVVATWAFVMNRTVVHWVDGLLKTGTLCVSGLALSALGLLSVRSVTRRWEGMALALLAVFGLGEVRRVWLRATYGVSPQIPSFTDTLRPVTTTDLTLRRFWVRVPPLGAARVRVAHVSDLHITDALPKAYYERIHAEIARLEPDVIVLTGDFASKEERIGMLSDWLRGLPRTPGGAFATLGNHDYWMEGASELRTAVERSGVRLMGGKCENVEVRDGRIRICGTDQPWGPAANLGRDDGENPPTLVLSHTPDTIYELAQAGAHAVFAGHTHGGQFRFPILGAVIVPSHHGRLFDRGHFVVQGTHLFVSAGVGADAPPLRLWCPPELVVVDLAGTAPSP